ncbi:unnamed protein product [Caenorhabditis sp. 36 PRJEB53466]|nr:unnamed protein product [Caenorhabditis sp. 36 PRJEB53466]
MADGGHLPRSPSRSPNVQRSTSFSGAKLHFNYSGKETKIRSSQGQSATPRLSRTNPSLQKQHTVDYPVSSSNVVVATSSDSPKRINYDQYNPKERSQAESLISYEPSSASTAFLEKEIVPPPVSTHFIPLPIARQSSITTPAPKPQSLNSQLALSQGRSRTLNIGYSADDRQQIEQAQAWHAELVRQREAEIKAKAAARKAEEEAAKREEAQKKEEAARKAEEDRRTRSVDDDEQVEKFIQNLEQRIKDSRDSKNGEGALVGRHHSQNHAAIAESLTNALKNEKKEEEEFEGHDGVGQGATQNGADSSEECNFLERIKNMKTDQNANRQKYAEHYYDFDDDDSELHSSTSIKSFLSTVTEEDLDSSSLNMTLMYDPQTEMLQQSVISYIHDLVDNVFSCLEKTDFVKLMANQLEKEAFEEYLYVNDSTHKYYVLSDNAKQFFTPRTSAENETADSTLF